MIFYQRKLLCLSCLALLFLLLISVFPHAVKLWIGILLLPVGAVLLLLSFGKHKGLRFLSLLLLLLFIASLSSFFYSHKQEQLLPLTSEEKAVTLQVSAITYESEDGCSGEGFLTKTEAQPCRIRVKFRADAPASAGDVLGGIATAKIYDATDYDATEGFVGEIRLSESTPQGTFRDLSLLLSRLRDFLCARIRTALPSQSGELFCAMLLGIRDGLDEGFCRDMSRIGTTHMLSLSGMHLLVLNTALAFLFKRLHTGKRLRFMLLSLFCVFFVLLTGASPSVLRAGIMFILASLSFFFREARDSLTALGAAVVFICLLFPYALFSLSLWLSACSTLGILLFFERQEKASERKGVLSFLKRYLLFSLAITLSAMLATLPLTAYTFRSVSLIAPLSNLILSPFISLVLYLSPFLLLFGELAPLCFVCDKTAKIVFTIAEELSHIENIVLPLHNAWRLGIVFLLFLGVFSYFALCPRRRFSFKAPMVFSLCCALLLGGTVAFDRISLSNGLHIAYYATEERSDLLHLTKEGAHYVIYAGDSRLPEAKAKREIYRKTGGEIDLFMMLGYTENTVAYLENTLSDYMVYRLYLPVPQGVYEKVIYQKVLSLAEKHKIKTVAYEKNTAFAQGDISFSVWRTSSFPQASAPLEILYAGKRIQYYPCGSVNSAMQSAMQNADILFFGAFPVEPLTRLESRQAFIKDEAVIVCPDARAFPFLHADGVPFGDRAGKRKISLFPQ